MQDKFLKYTIGEVCKILNITQGGIRFYEKKGIITSKREEKNQYRYYTFRDINTIMIVREYRALGFSLEEAGELIKESSTSHVENKFDEQISKIEEIIKLNRMILEKLKIKKDRINDIHKYLNKHIIKDRQAMYRLNCQTRETVIRDIKLKKLMKEWNERIPNVKFCHCIPKENLAHDVPVEIGFCVLEDNLDFNIEKNEYTNYYPTQKCVYTIIEVKEIHMFIKAFYKLIEPALNYIKENNLEIVDDILGYKIATLDIDGQRDYYEVFFPIK